LQNVPVSYLVWIVDNVTNRPQVVALVKQYFNGSVPTSPVSAKKPSVQDLLTRLKAKGPTPALVVAAKPQSGEEGGASDIFFPPYSFPAFQHPLKDTRIGGRYLYEYSLPELDEIINETSDPKLKDFMVYRIVHFYRWMVYHFYKDAVSIDVSKLSPGGQLQYQEVMDTCRRIQSVLDTSTEPAAAIALLRSSQFDDACGMTLPGKASP